VARMGTLKWRPHHRTRAFGSEIAVKFGSSVLQGDLARGLERVEKFEAIAGSFGERRAMLRLSRASVYAQLGFAGPPRPRHDDAPRRKTTVQAAIVNRDACHS